MTDFWGKVFEWFMILGVGILAFVIVVIAGLFIAAYALPFESETEQGQGQEDE